ncbi:MAG: hypothetical protein VXW49_13220 [Pseudomonadota bacterium]|nr:hypothetical protein [Pseudomonadota bacterium]
MSDQAYDVVVVSAENAALCTAISAKLRGTHVLVLEKASEDEKGGNFYFTAGGFRFTHIDLTCCPPTALGLMLAILEKPALS